MSEPTGRPPATFPAGARSGPETEPSARAPRAVSDLRQVTIEADDALEREALEKLDPGPATRRRRSGASFGKLFISALGALVSMMAWFAVDQFVRDLFARNVVLGWVAFAVAMLLLAGALGVAARELYALSRLASVERERRDGLAAYESNSDAGARAVVARLVSLLAGRPETAAGRTRLADLEDDVIDGRDRIVIAESELLMPLDLRARALVLASAKRVSVVTAVSPRAVVDLAFVLFETVRLIRAVSELYGARPGAIGLVRLVRDVLAHLAVTGSIAIGDSVLQQMVGHGLAARLSAKLGEGIVNGLLTARIGLAAMDLCRPLPFLRTRRPSIGDFLKDLSGLADTPRG